MQLPTKSLFYLFSKVMFVLQLGSRHQTPSCNIQLNATASVLLQYTRNKVNIASFRILCLRSSSGCAIQQSSLLSSADILVIFHRCFGRHCFSAPTLTLTRMAWSLRRPCKVLVCASSATEIAIIAIYIHSGTGWKARRSFQSRHLT